MPAKPQDNMKGTSPSPSIQKVVNNNWGKQNQTSTTAQAALAKKYTDNPVSVKGKK